MVGREAHKEIEVKPVDDEVNPLNTEALAPKRVVAIEKILDTAIKWEASDVHLVVGKPPAFSVDGELHWAKTRNLETADLKAAIRAIVPENLQPKILENGGVDFALSIKDGQGRFRVNIGTAQSEQFMTIRRLPNKMLTPEEIGLPKEVLDLVQSPRGLFLVTGQTGSGKTTTLASLVNYISATSDRKIITIEQPTEYKFEHGRGLVIQREVPNDVPSFRQGLEDALRQAPQVIMLGEMRDLETMRVALAAAETGHLVLATLHTSSAPKTIDRLIGEFPAEEHDQVRVALSTALKGILCQQLIQRADKNGRVCALEFLNVNSAIANHIREGRTFQIHGAMQTSKAEGNRLLDDELWNLYSEGIIKAEDAIFKANEKAAFRKKLEKHSQARGN